MAVVEATFLSLLGAVAVQDPGLDPRPCQPFFRRYCSDCHLGGMAKGEVDLVTISTDLRDAEPLHRWIRIYDRVRQGEMPPPRKYQAPATERDAFLKGLGGSLTRADLARRTVVFRRRNRIAYENSVRDLLGVAAAGKKDFLGPAIVVGNIEIEGPLESWPPPGFSALKSGPRASGRGRERGGAWSSPRILVGRGRSGRRP